MPSESTNGSPQLQSFENVFPDFKIWNTFCIMRHIKKKRCGLSKSYDYKNLRRLRINYIGFIIEMIYFKFFFLFVVLNRISVWLMTSRKAYLVKSMCDHFSSKLSVGKLSIFMCFRIYPPAVQ